MKRGMEEATQGVLRDLLQGRGLETLALPAPDPRKQITHLPYSAGLHRYANEEKRGYRKFSERG